MAQVLPFTETDLKAAAGPSVFALGVDRLGLVTDLETGDGEITATVSGEYEVSLTIEVGPRSGIVTLYADCPCPAGLEDDFCEHCVAVGLAALRHDAAGDRGPLVSWLTSLTKNELVAEILGLADDDEELSRRLAAKAAARAASPGRVRDAVRRLLKPAGHVGREYADSVYQAANMIDSLIEDNGDAIGLARESFAWVKEASARSGYASPLIAEAARELLVAHLRACAAADPPPDPVELGTYLADLLVQDDFGVTPSLEDYSSLLGREGTVAIRDRVKAVHRAEPGNRNARHLTEAILKAEGDADALASFYRDELDRNLKEIESLKTASGDDAYRRLARLLAEAREYHVALGTAGQFTRYLSRLRADLKRRRNLMKILDENGL